MTVGLLRDPPAMIPLDGPLISDKVAVLDLDEWLPSRRRRRGAIAAVAINGRGISGGDSDGAVRSMTLRLPLRVSILFDVVRELLKCQVGLTSGGGKVCDVLMIKDSFGGL